MIICWHLSSHSFPYHQRIYHLFVILCFASALFVERGSYLADGICSRIRSLYIDTHQYIVASHASNNDTDAASVFVRGISYTHLFFFPFLFFSFCVFVFGPIVRMIFFPWVKMNLELSLFCSMLYVEVFPSCLSVRCAVAWLCALWFSVSWAWLVPSFRLWLFRKTRRQYPVTLKPKPKLQLRVGSLSLAMRLFQSRAFFFSSSFRFLHCTLERLSLVENCCLCVSPSNIHCFCISSMSCVSAASWLYRLFFHQMIVHDLEISRSQRLFGSNDVRGVVV